MSLTCFSPPRESRPSLLFFCRESVCQRGRHRLPAGDAAPGSGLPAGGAAARRDRLCVRNETPPTSRLLSWKLVDEQEFFLVVAVLGCFGSLLLITPDTVLLHSARKPGRLFHCSSLRPAAFQLSPRPPRTKNVFSSSFVRGTV